MGGKLNATADGRRWSFPKKMDLRSNKFPAPVIGNLVCDLGDLRFLESLCDKNQSLAPFLLICSFRSPTVSAPIISPQLADSFCTWKSFVQGLKGGTAWGFLCPEAEVLCPDRKDIVQNISDSRYDLPCSRKNNPQNLPDCKYLPGIPCGNEKAFPYHTYDGGERSQCFTGPHTSFPNGDLSLRQFQHISFHLRQELRRDLHISINGIVYPEPTEKWRVTFRILPCPT